MNTTYLYHNLYFPSARLSGTPLFAPVKRSAGTTPRPTLRTPNRPAPAPAPGRTPSGWTNHTPRRPDRLTGTLAAALMAILATGGALASLSGSESAGETTRHVAE